MYNNEQQEATMIKRIILILLLSLSLLNAADYKEINQSSDTNTLSKIIAIPLYPVIFIGGLATILFEGTAIVISYPIRTLIKEKKDKR